MNKLIRLSSAAIILTASASFATVTLTNSYASASHAEAVITTAEVQINPSAGDVETLKTFVLTFPGAQEVAQGVVSYDTAPYVIQTGVENASKQYCFTFSFDANTISLSVSSDIEEPGTYELHLPGAFYLIDGESPEEELVWEYTVIGKAVSV